MALTVSFIIPAFNEEKHIGNTLSSIRKAGDFVQLNDIIVVDNCSTDRTQLIAQEHSATVLTIEGGPVSRLRNIGVQHASGDVLIFVDADVSLTQAWYSSINSVIDRIEVNPGLVSGSHCSVPENSNNWLEKYWFSSFEGATSSHLGTGHMIMGRKVFDSVGGFAEHLETGEDYDICARIKQAGGVIEEAAELRVIHNDFPQNLPEFIRREIWHGKGDAGSLSAVLQSRVSMVSLIFLALHVFFAIAVYRHEYSAVIFTVLLLALLLFAVSSFKFGVHGIRTVAVNAVIYYFYFVGRTVALFKCR